MKINFTFLRHGIHAAGMQQSLAMIVIPKVLNSNGLFPEGIVSHIYYISDLVPNGSQSGSGDIKNHIPDIIVKNINANII